jgi:hypothetical protein
MSGRFDLDGEIAAIGDSTIPAGSFNGTLQFSAEDGRIHHRKGFLAIILDFLNLTEMFRGKVPDLGKEGYAYNSIKVRGNIEQGVLKLQEAVMDGSSMNMVGLGDVDLVEGKLELTVLVAPLKTVDFIVRNIPIVGHILGGNLVSIPYKVDGDIEEPDVTPIPPSAVGSGLLGIMERTLTLPVTIMQPLISANEEQEKVTKEEKKEGEEEKE